MNAETRGSSGYKFRRAEKRKCYNCNEVGHLARNCLKPKKEQKRVGFSEANHATLLMTRTDSRATSLLLDSGASDHMCCDIALLSDVRKIPAKKVYLGNGSILLAEKIGSMLLQPKGTLRNGIVEVIENVLLVSKLTTNLMSCSQLCIYGYEVLFNSDGCKALYDGVVRFEGSLHNKMYELNAEIVSASPSILMNANTSAVQL